jgi:phosphopantetheine--protein transferase-like protein
MNKIVQAGYENGDEAATSTSRDTERSITQKQIPIKTTTETDFNSFLRANPELMEDFLKSGYDIYSAYLGKEKTTESKVISSLSEELIGITGIGVGLPGKNQSVFDDENIDLILSGHNFIDSVNEEIKQDILSKNINRLVKSPDGSASFEEINELSQVISLAGQMGEFDPIDDFKLDEKLLQSLDITFTMAICAGLEALADAGIPLVKSSITTTTGKILEGDWALPEELQAETGIIFASAFPGYDNLIKELNEYQQSEDKKSFRRNFLFRILSMGHSQFAQLIKAKGPNTQINAACASTTQAIGVAEDWIRTGRCNRVIVIAADDAAGETLLPWIGSGFLVAGGVSTESEVEKAAIPFGTNRHGLIIGSAAAGIIIENETAYSKRGVKPIVDLIGSQFANSAFHGSRLDVKHITNEFENFVDKIEKRFEIPRKELAEEGIFVSHETYTPARGGSAESEIEALKAVFGNDASKMTIVNTKGFTGHAMGVGIEECVAIKSMEKGIIPPIANYDQIDPVFSDLKFSRGENRRVRYALRLAAGFGSQIAFTAFRLNTPEERVDLDNHEKWLEHLGGGLDDGFLDGRVLKLRTRPRKIKTSSDSVARKPKLPAIAAGNILPELINIISEITGYESNLIEADMHLEEDLGIDTIKQAEIFGIVRDKWDLELDETLSLADFTTPNKIVSYIQDKIPQTSSAPLSKKSEVSLITDDSGLKSKIKDIVSEATGYEPDLIEDDMDLEEDLGIDTIKQAEIFGDIREMYNLVLDETVSLAEFRSIQDIANYVSQNASQITSDTAVIRIDEEEKQETGKDKPEERDVTIEKLILSPAILDKEKANKVKLTDINSLVIDLNSSRTQSILEELTKKKIRFYEYNLFEDSVTKLKDMEFDTFIIILPDDETTPGHIDQEIYNKMFKLFQKIDLNSEQKILAISDEKSFGFEKDAKPISGGISGFIKTLGLEFEMKVKHLYSSKNKEIIQEIEYWDDIIEISYIKNLRYTIVYSDITEVVTKSSKLDLKNDDLLLVTGGGRGITFSCLEALCTIVKPKVAIFGIEDISHCTPEILVLSEEQLQEHKDKMIEELRATEEKVTPVMIDRKWNSFMFGLEVSRNLQKLEKLKIKAEYYRVDVTKQKEVEKTITKLEKEFDSKVTHIVHGAGLEESKSFKKKKFDFSKLIVSVKVEGIWNILNVVEKENLKRVVCFTSIAGRFGNRGQIDYSFANGYLSRLCWMLNQQGIPSIACDWSAWGGVGMATRGSIMKVLTSFGINPISLESGTSVFVKLFLNEIGKEVIVSNGLGPFEAASIPEQNVAIKNYPLIDSIEYIDSKFRAYHQLSVDTDLYMVDHQIENVPVFPGVMGLEMFSEMYQITSLSTPFILKEIEFLSALKLQKNHPKRIFVEYDPSNNEMSLKSIFIPKGDEKLKRNIEHFKLQIGTEIRKRTKRKSSVPIDDTKIPLMLEDEIYKLFFHGRSFQVLSNLLDLEDDMAITSVRIPEEEIFAEKGSKVLINPRTIEAALQTAGLYDLIVNNESSLPSTINKVTLYNNKQPHHIIAQFKQKDENFSYFDVEIYDESKQLIVLLEGLGMIHTQFAFTEDSESKEKLKTLKDYWQISNSFSENMIKITPIQMVSKQYETQPKAMMKYLSTEEKASFNRKKSEKRKIEYLAGVITAKQLIKNISKDPKSIKTTEIRKTTKGQPYIYDSKKKEKSNLNLSITHSGDFAIAAIGECPIGIDIEKIEDRSESFYKEAFTEKERDKISSDSELGTVYWTIKEAITKALGEGLNLSLHDIEISEDEKKSSYKVDFSSKAAESVPYDSDSFEITSKKFHNYTLSYCEIKPEDKK